MCALENVGDFSCDQRVTKEGGKSERSVVEVRFTGFLVKNVLQFCWSYNNDASLAGFLFFKPVNFLIHVKVGILVMLLLACFEDQNHCVCWSNALINCSY